MIRKIKLLTISIVVIAFTFSCSKEDTYLAVYTNSEVENDFDIKMSVSRQKYMNDISLGNEQELFMACQELEKNSKSEKSSEEVWGTGTDGRVYKFNGSGWLEPSAAARLKRVELCTYGGTVWGLGADARIYKWNGTGWSEPNPNAGLYQISPLSSSDAIGIGCCGKLYFTIDGGLSWQRFMTTDGVKSVSAGDIFNLWIVYKDNKLYKHTGGLGYSGTWQYVSSVAMKQVQTMYPGGIWALSTTNKIYKSNYLDGSGLYQPNSSNGVYQISAVSSETAWGVGSSNRIFKTSNCGATWTEPVPSAGLFHVAIGYAVY